MNGETECVNPHVRYANYGAPLIIVDMESTQYKALELTLQMSVPQYNVVDELQTLSVEEIRSKQQSLSANFGICCMNLRAEGNAGMIARSACLFGAKQMIICGRKCYDKRFTVGAHHYLDIQHWPDVLQVTIDPVPPEFVATCRYDAAAFVERLCGTKWRPVFVEQGGEDLRDAFSADTTEHNLFIVGNESTGIPDHFIDSVRAAIPETRVVSIPQWSVLRSMNVAMAATVVMWEARTNMSRRNTFNENGNQT
jgi:tRNA G18 (ribose-2'-O)-methylase SpoU